MKLHVIGLPSSGKTTLAADLAARLGLQHHDLDAVAYLDQQWTLRPPKDREELVAQILEEPGFVSEGGFIGWVTPLLAAADGIVWLDPPLRVLMWRHVRRFGLLHLRWLIARLRFQVLCYLRPMGKGPAKDGPDQTRSGIEAALRPWGNKVLRLRQPATADEVIGKLRGLRGETP